MTDKTTTGRSIPRISFRLASDPLLNTFVSARILDDWDSTELNEVTRTALQLHAVHADRAIRSHPFTEAEVMLMLDAVNGWAITPSSAAYLRMEITDALDDLAVKWKVTKKEILGKLKVLPAFDAAVLAYALRSAWDVMPRFDGDLRAAAVSLGLLPQVSDAGRDL